jgi:hypothetical protein
MSTLKADTIVAADGSSPVTLTKQHASKAYLLADQNTSLSILTSFNIASVSDEGAGEIKSNFTNSFDTANYVAVGMADEAASDFGVMFQSRLLTPTSSSYQTVIINVSNNSTTDEDFNHIVIHGDLA